MDNNVLDELIKENAPIKPDINIDSKRIIALSKKRKEKNKKVFRISMISSLSLLFFYFFYCLFLF